MNPDRIALKTKNCTRCKKRRFKRYFYRNREHKDGLESMCKKCSYEYCAKWQKDNPEKIRISHKKWRDNHPEQVYLISRRWQRNHPRKVSVIQKRWNKKNYEKRRMWARKWRKENPERVKAIDKKRDRCPKRKKMQIVYTERHRARKAHASGFYTLKDINRIRKKQKDKCRYCKIRLYGKGATDHKTPLTRGGSNNPCNLCLACKSCNSSKGNKTEKEYVATLC